MKMVIAYSSLKNNSNEKIRSTLCEYLAENEYELYRNIRTLSGRLRQPGNGWHIALLSAENEEELEEILSINGLFTGIRILLVLPYRNQKMISKGFQLFPRLITFTDGNFEELGAVLDKMIHKIKIKNDRGFASISRQNIYSS